MHRHNEFLFLTLGWSRTGTATRTVILIGLSRVMSIILLFSYGMWGIDDGEPENEMENTLSDLFMSKVKKAKMEKEIGLRVVLVLFIFCVLLGKSKSIQGFVRIT